MSKIPVSLQLYSVREATAKDFAATVKEVAAIGYSGVGSHGCVNTRDKAKMAWLFNEARVGDLVVVYR